MRVGRLAPGMGLSWNPHLCLHWSGAFNGPTGYGGGGTFPPMDWVWGTPIPWRRKPLTEEFYCVAGCTVTLMEFHRQHGLDEAELVQAVNQGFPTAVSWALDTSIGEWLQASGHTMDMPMRRQPPGEYVCSASWTPSVPGSRAGAAAVLERGAECMPLSKEPSAEECLRTLRASDVDFTLPMHPGRHATDRENLQSSSISHYEWVQQFHFGILLDELELEAGTAVAYAAGVKKLLDLMRRGYPLEDFGPRHAELRGDGLFKPAVWKPCEIEKVLMDCVLHEAAVRGNSWSTVRVQLYGIRHHNIRQGLPDPLSGKLRLAQRMRALKKMRGPKAGKLPVTRAMMLAICEHLAWAEDGEALTEWAALLTAWHFMMRSSEYCAKLGQGRFDLDYVVRMCDVVFLRRGVVITEDLQNADEVQITFGKQKASAGGEVRSHTASKVARDMCVVRVLAALVSQRGDQFSQKPLFSWPKGSGRFGEGVTYSRVMELVRVGAELCGRDTKLYATHSLRRGGANEYYLAGQSLQSVQLFGRWVSIESVKLYTSEGVSQVMRGMQEVMLGGTSGLRVLEQAVPRPREMQMWRAAQTVQRLKEA